MPRKEHEFQIILDKLYERIDAADIWIPYEEIHKRFMGSRMGRVDKIEGQISSMQATNNGGGGSSLFSITSEEGEIIRLRKFTPLECERLQTIPDNYTALGIDEKGNEVKISNTQRYRMVGNSWTCSVISHIFKNLK